MALSLRAAAQHTGTKPSTILRAIRSGRLSVERDGEGAYRLDPEELERLFSADRKVEPGAVPLARLRVVAPDSDSAKARA